MSGASDPVTRNLIWTAAFLAACLFVIVPLGAIDARTLDGVNVWDKPFKFAISLTIHFATLAVLVQLLPEDARRGRTLRVFTALAVAAAVYEILYISLQAMRGRRSHFNFETMPEIYAYQAMGVGAVLLIALPFVMGILILRRTPADGSSTREGAVWGMIASAVLTFIVAGYMSTSGGHWVGQTAGDATGLPLFGWSREVGDLRPSHFVATHLMQGLPLLGWLIDRTGIGGRWLVYLALIASTVLCGYLFGQALAGAPMIPL
jgi:DMSO/TMAO reductase YedYZ heme-binding membrane subunit